MKGNYKVTINDKTLIVGDESLASFSIGIEEGDFHKMPKFSIWGATDWRGKVVRHMSWISHEVVAGDVITIECLVAQKPEPPEKNIAYGKSEGFCMFCRRQKSQVRMLIQSDDTFCICDECVEDCNRIIERELNSAP